MRLDEAKEILKKNGYLLEDTDDYDDADLGINTKSKRYTSFDKRMRDKHRNHNYYDYNTKLSNAIIDCGVKGPQFGAVLNELKNWYYGAFLYNHKKPTQEEIEDKVEELMR